MAQVCCSFPFFPGSWYCPIRDLKQRGRRWQGLGIVKKQYFEITNGPLEKSWSAGEVKNIYQCKGELNEKNHLCQVTLKNIHALVQKNHTREVLNEMSPLLFKLHITHLYCRKEKEKFEKINSQLRKNPEKSFVTSKNVT